jgi:hypothetical protein
MMTEIQKRKAELRELVDREHFNYRYRAAKWKNSTEDWAFRLASLMVIAVEPQLAERQIAYRANILLKGGVK